MPTFTDLAIAIVHCRCCGNRTHGIGGVNKGHTHIGRERMLTKDQTESFGGLVGFQAQISGPDQEG